VGISLQNGWHLLAPKAGPSTLGHGLRMTTKLHALGDPLTRPERLLDVVFVHGAGGDWKKSWGLQRMQEGGEADSMVHWLLAEPDLAGIGVWSLEHESDKSWLGRQGSLGRKELAKKVLAELINSQLIDPAPPRRPICWVAHSEGGNLLKQLLYYCQLQRDGDLGRSHFAAAILGATTSIYFIDTPHRGSWLARLPIPVLRDRVRRELRPGDPELDELHGWYVDTLDKQIQSFNFHQCGERFKVVGTASALLDRAECNFAIDRHHNKIAKPLHKDDEPYRQIKDHLVRIRREHQTTVESQSPVPSVPLRLKRNGHGDALERLLCFAVPELGAFDPAMANRQGKRFRLLFWLTKADGLPEALDQAWIEGLTSEALIAEIARVYAEQLNEDPSGRLLLALFLPFDLLASDGLSGFVEDLSLRTCQHLPNCTGVPMLLGCSSRWPVGCSAHPQLGMTRHSFRVASQRLVGRLFQDPGPEAASLRDLNWLTIAADSPLPSQAPTGQPMARPAAIASILEAAALVQEPSAAAGRDEGLGDADEAPDPLAERDAVYLSESPDGDRDPTGQRVLEQLLMRGIPLIWRANPQALDGRAQPLEGMQCCHPLDAILAWDGLLFLDRFYSYRLDPASEADRSNHPLRHFIRRSTLFWEDHRHIPTIHPIPTNPSDAQPLQGVAPESATPFHTPFRASPP